MSCIPIAAAESAEVCANCGKESSDVVKLRNCTACYLVKYCSVECQKIHRKKHKKACKERAAELKDEKLYDQGHERPAFDFCPICLLAIPFPMEEYASIRPCCMKLVCNGCIHAMHKQGLLGSCPFCRSPMPKNSGEELQMIQIGVAAKDPEAISHLAGAYFNGKYGMEKDVPRAFELWTEAADLGSVTARFKLGMAYYLGDKGVTQDKAKGVRCLESAAMEGDAESRHMLGFIEVENGNCDRAVRHFMISAKMGHKNSLDAIKIIFEEGQATKQQFAEALKGYQDAVEETKSPGRDEAARI